MPGREAGGPGGGGGGGVCRVVKRVVCTGGAGAKNEVASVDVEWVGVSMKQELCGAECWKCGWVGGWVIEWVSRWVGDKL